MSIIRNNDLPLESIVSSSNLIVEVKTVEPYEERIPIISDKNKAIPDFIKVGLIFRVKRILKNTSGNVIPELIKIPNENWRRYLSQHKEQYAGGPSKSFTINKYRSKVFSMSDANILFLNSYSGDFSLTAQNSFESLDSLAIIESIINQ